MDETYSYQCKKCGELLSPEAARDFETVPAICHICQGGVRISENPHGGFQIVIPEPENWIILADLPEGELTKDPKRKHLKTEQIVRPHGIKREKAHPRQIVVDNVL